MTERYVRLPMVDPDDVGERGQELSRWPKRDGIPPLALFRVLSRVPALAAAMRPLGGLLLGRSGIPPRARELVILRVCATLGCEYEWGVHASAFAAEAGLTADEVLATTEPLVEAGWSRQDADLLLLVDQLCALGTLDDQTWARAEHHWRSDQLLELIVLAGWYHVICFIANAARLVREEWTVSMPRDRGDAR